MSRLISLFAIEPLAEQLAARQLLITPNQRLASRIRSAYAIHCRENGQRVVEAPRVYSINSWIDHLWNSLSYRANANVSSYKLLSVVQEQFIWEQIVETTALGTALLRPAATAAQALSAYRTMIDWQHDFLCPSLRDQFQQNEDCAVFLSWVDTFEQRCTQEHWLPQSKRAQQLIQCFTNGALSQEGQIIGVGFDDLSPLHHTLIDSAGTFTQLKLGAKAPLINVVSCENEKQELLSAAVWAKKTLRDDPNATVALVIKDLSNQRETIQRVLQEVFEPDFNYPENPRRNLPFNFSAGYALIEAPIIVAAMNALLLCEDSLAIDIAVALCQSPFYCLDHTQLDAVSRLITVLYKERSHTLSTAKLRQLALKVSNASALASTDSAGVFASALHDIANYARSIAINKQRSASAWLPVIQEILHTIGWPGARALDSIEFQQVKQWQQTCEQFSSLDNVFNTISFNKAIACLRGILSRQTFQPQTADSSLQVLGTLEAAGLEFSHIWLHSMSAQQWPPAPSPNALLPFQLQREDQMPQATAERELNYATRLSHRFLHSANTVVISYPATIDENPTRISTLYADYPQVPLIDILGKDLDTLVPLTEIRRRHLEAATIQVYQQGDAPLLNTDEITTGGSQLFASQAACPFRSFALHRLGLQVLPEPVLGLDAADKGTLLHRALELIWEKLNSQQNLIASSENELQKLCENAAEYALSELSVRRPLLLGPRYRQLERQRLTQLLSAWLEIEKQRAPFVVQSIESRKTYQFFELTLQTRIDRIDKLEDGSLVIIDYKTGNTNINNWWGHRPSDPQLPLYSVLTEEYCQEEEALGGIAYAQVRSDGCVLNGVGDDQLAEHMLQWQDKLKVDTGVESWQQLKQQWQKVLSALAQDFIRGKSAVDPKQQPQTCQYCHLASLCRVKHHE